MLLNYLEDKNISLLFSFRKAAKGSAFTFSSVFSGIETELYFYLYFNHFKMNLLWKNTKPSR